MPKAGGLLDQDGLFVHFLMKIKHNDSMRADLDEAERKMRGGSQ